MTYAANDPAAFIETWFWAGGKQVDEAATAEWRVWMTQRMKEDRMAVQKIDGILVPSTWQECSALEEGAVYISNLGTPIAKGMDWQMSIAHDRCVGYFMNRADAIKAAQAFLPEVKEKPAPSLTLTGQQLRNAAEFVNPDGEKDPDQLETEATIQHFGSVKDGDDATQPDLPAGLYIWLTEYPEEGCVRLATTTGLAAAVDCSGPPVSNDPQIGAAA